MVVPMRSLRTLVWISVLSFIPAEAFANDTTNTTPQHSADSTKKTNPGIHGSAPFEPAARPRAGLKESAIAANPESARLEQEPIQKLFGKWPAAEQLRLELKSLEATATKELKTPFELMVSNPINPSMEVRMVEWSRMISIQLNQLESLASIADANAGAILSRLGREAQSGYADAEKVSNLEHRKQWRCASYSVIRRAEVWKAVWAAINTDANAAQWKTSEADPLYHHLGEAITSVEQLLSQTGDQAGWSRFLLLDELRKTESNGGTKLSTEDRKLAQRVLARVEKTQLTKRQTQWLEQAAAVRFLAALHRIASSPVDYETLLQQIEQIESNELDQANDALAQAYRNLRFSEKSEDRKIANALDVHYRNANLRMAISSRLLNRLLPENEPMTVPIQTKAMGANIRGESQIESALKLTLNPATDHWNLALQSVGDITTLSTGKQSVVQVHTSGKANFKSATQVTVDRTGIALNRTDVDVSGKIRLRKIQSELDEYPILGGFVRTVAERRFHAMAPEANRITNRTVRNQIRAEIDGTLDEHRSLAETKLDATVIQPLIDLQLAPAVTQMQTTEELLLGRFRIAGDDQLAAFTPRPRDASDSLINLQIHQSAINNTLEQLLPSGATKPIDEVLREIAAAFGQENWQTPEDMPEDVEVRFASSRPVFIEIEDGKLTLTLRIVQLKRGRAVDLRNVIIKASYRPECEGLHAYFVRDGHLSISGPNMSMRKRLPARTIFSKVLSTNHTLPITTSGLADRPLLEGLHITQLELERGWIALALAEERQSVAFSSP